MKSNRIIECVPNFSEGRNREVLNSIAAAISSVDGVSLLHTDAGATTHRTVFTFAGEPEPVIEAAFRAIKAATERIDMRQHRGAHPRIGATDVCPLVPISGISMAETVALAKKLGERVANELQIPVYFYEEAATAPHRKNLADIRAGEYEGLAEKMKLPEWQPDCGPREFNAKSGATVIGARDFLVAYNVNLNTRSVGLAHEVAQDIRENGRPLRDPTSGKVMRNDKGEVLRLQGLCPGVRAIGWYIDEYRMAQVSMNLTDLQKTPLHKAFVACCQTAEKYGLRVTGSELVGLVPKQVLLDAGMYFLKLQKRSAGMCEEDIIDLAIQTLGLNSVQVFEPDKRIIEYMLDKKTHRLVDLSVRDFLQQTASESPAPGGGSVSALVGALGLALATMVANLSANKKTYRDQFDFFDEHAKQGQHYLRRFLELVDEDTAAFNAVIEAIRLPKGSKAEKQARKNAILEANKYAMQVPFEMLKLAHECLYLIEAMAQKGNPNSNSDSAVGALCLETAARGAALNVYINSKAIEDESITSEIVQKTRMLEAEIRHKVQSIADGIYRALN